MVLNNAPRNQDDHVEGIAVLKDDHFTRDDLLAVGAAYDVRHDGRVILDEVDAVLDDWPDLAKKAGISRELIAQIGGQFHRFRAA
jgi:hypothetical protein